MSPEHAVESMVPDGRISDAKPKLLLLDDREYLLRIFTEAFTAQGFEVAPWLILSAYERSPQDNFTPQKIIKSHEEFIEALKAEPFDAVLSDNQMRDVSDNAPQLWGLDAAAIILRQKPGTPFIIHSDMYSDMPGSDGHEKMTQCRDALQVIQKNGTNAFAKPNHFEPDDFNQKCGEIAAALRVAMAQRDKGIEIE